MTELETIFWAVVGAMLFYDAVNLLVDTLVDKYLDHE